MGINLTPNSEFFQQCRYEERMKIIEICNQKGIQYSGVLRNAKYYEMEACQYSCEDCSICAPKDN